MSGETPLEHLPPYNTFSENIATLALPISSSELHGIMCGYLCAGAYNQGESYLQALISMTTRQKDDMVRAAAMAMFGVYTLSQQQLIALDFDFQLMLPDDEETLAARARAFSEWCDGFTQGLAMAGITHEHFEDEESQDALQHLIEFAQLDYENLDVSEEDEKALVEVSEYARMAILRLCNDLQASKRIKTGGGSSGTRH
ncbi:UPF0149 family protein [Legionella dresdenensis]|uniref:UPF0149 family protein n=1 Tax=Legionella dresdenensis TaxID=450200 RepID=A0ABV8CDJ8_9GAMM